MAQTRQRANATIEPRSARRIGRTDGRPPKLTDNDAEAAKATPANPGLGATQIAPSPPPNTCRRNSIADPTVD